MDYLVIIVFILTWTHVWSVLNWSLCYSTMVLVLIFIPHNFVPILLCFQADPFKPCFWPNLSSLCISGIYISELGQMGGDKWIRWEDTVVSFQKNWEIDTMTVFITNPGPFRVGSILHNLCCPREAISPWKALKEFDPWLYYTLNVGVIEI